SAFYAVLTALALSQCLLAQQPVFDASQLRAPSQLSAKWRIRAGDDPAYAQPGFDDSQWTPFDPHTSLHNIFDKSKPSIVWYRLRVKVDPTQPNLALDESGLARAFEIYANGEPVLVLGRVAPYAPYTDAAHILALIPKRLLASGTLLLAMRVYIAPTEWLETSPGYVAKNLSIGEYGTLRNEDLLSIIGAKTVDWLDDLMFTGLGLIALVLFLAQRSQKEYFWIFAAGALTLLDMLVPVISTFYAIPKAYVVASLFLRPAEPIIWGILYLTFVHQRIGWRWRTFLILAGISNMVAAMQTWLFTLPLAASFLFNLPVIVLFAAVIPGLLAYHWRRGNREAGILLIPAVIFSLALYAEVGFGLIYQLIPAWRPVAVHVLRATQQIQAGPFTFSLGNIADIGCALALAVIILLRSMRMTRRQAQLDAELEAAQQVQQVLVPEKIASIPGFVVDAVYLPAQQVGGDFFQVLPAGNGGLVVVVGDVAGKGLPAAMLVSALVGSIRTVLDDTHAPDSLLHRLNERLIGRTHGGFATALAAYITHSGAVSIANAGHLSPYLDGREVPLPGALPLGVASPIRYETISLELPPGSRLTFYSDGVIEAQNQRGELFGFDRAASLSTEPAPKVAQAARAFGQQDDITVVTILREQIAVSAA
ncbi:MAG TPA: PP2C family protein-serine/threonine phosphatase, partial [Terracidiphilus sp.]